MLSDSRADFWTAATAHTVSRSPWTALRPGVVQHGEFHSAEQAGGEIDCQHGKNQRYTRRSLSDLDCSYTILKKVRDGRYNPIF